VPWLLVQRRPFSSSSMPNEPSSKSSLTPSHVDFRTTTYSRQGSGVNPCLNPLSRSRTSTSARRFSPVSTTSPRSDSIRASRNPPDRSQTYDHRLVADACFDQASAGVTRTMQRPHHDAEPPATDGHVIHRFLLYCRMTLDSAERQTARLERLRPGWRAAGISSWWRARSPSLPQGRSEWRLIDPMTRCTNALLASLGVT
jgi:hypothetical protein